MALRDPREAAGVTGGRAFFGLFGLILVLNLAWWGFVIFVIVKVLQHFGVL